MNEETTTSSYTLLRIVAALLALPMAGFALLVGSRQLRTGFDPMTAIFAACAATLAALAGWFALRGHVAESRRQMMFGVAGGVVLGGIGFAAGFIGPIILTPEANQGPLLGIFITGPLGFCLGVALGWLYSVTFVRRPA